MLQFYIRRSLSRACLCLSFWRRRNLWWLFWPRKAASCCSQMPRAHLVPVMAWACCLFLLSPGFNFLPCALTEWLPLAAVGLSLEQMAPGSGAVLLCHIAQNHRVCSAGREPSGSLCPAPGLAGDTPAIPFVPDTSSPQAALGLWPCPWGSCSVPDHPLGVKPFLVADLNLPWFTLSRFLASCHRSREWGALYLPSAAPQEDDEGPGEVWPQCPLLQAEQTKCPQLLLVKLPLQTPHQPLASSGQPVRA